jgi:hypothetical protein
MLSTFWLFINGFLVLVVLPIVVRDLIIGSPPNPGGPFRKYQLAVPYLTITGNIFLLCICLLAVKALALHFGLINFELDARLEPWIETPFLIMFVLQLAVWGMALVKVHRSA